MSSKSGEDQLPVDSVEMLEVGVDIGSDLARYGIKDENVSEVFGAVIELAQNSKRQISLHTIGQEVVNLVLLKRFRGERIPLRERISYRVKESVIRSDRERLLQATAAESRMRKLRGSGKPKIN